MAIETVAEVLEYTGDGATVIFPITFDYLEDEYVLVKHFDSSTNILSTLVLTDDYTISNGEVQTVLTYPIGDKIYLTLSVIFTQEVDLLENGQISSDILDLVHDKLTLMAQELNIKKNGTLYVELPESTNDLTIPPTALRADRILCFDSNGDVTVKTFTDLDAVSVTPWAETLIDDADAAEARTTLDVYSEAEVDTTTDVISDELDVISDELDVISDELDDLKYSDLFLSLINLTGLKIVASDAEASDYFGYSVSVDGDYAIVGAYGEDTGGSASGAAYIFHKTGGNTWDSGTKIVASDASADDFFGFSVSINGDYAIVGADHEGAGGSEAGAAYIFHRTGTNTWDSGTKIVASDAEASDNFGYSVSINGDYAIVGADGEDTGGNYAGAAYIFHRTGTNTWDSGTKIVASDAEASDQFSKGVSINGDYAIVGAYGESSNSGAAYVFHRTGTNTWDSGTKIVAPDAAADDLFGGSVSINGDYAIVGAYGESSSSGAAYVFYRTGINSWDSGTKIVAPDAETGDYFGKGVSINGDYAMVGANGEDTGGSSAGASYIFHRTGINSWDSGTKIVAPDAEAGDDFGLFVSISSDCIIIGANHEAAGGANAGAAYIYILP